MAEGKKNKKNNEFQSPYTVSNAIVKGGWTTKISILIMGFGNLCAKQFVKGFSFLAIEIAYVWFMIKEGFHCLVMLPSLGDKVQDKVWNDALGIFEYTKGDNSLLILLYGVATVFITLAFILIWRSTLKSAYMSECCRKENKAVLTFKDDIKGLFDQNLHRLLLSFPILGILMFTIVPLIFMICMAFTNYSKIDDHLVLFDWVGFANFAKVLDFSGTTGQTFWGVLGWTLVWAFFATFLNYFLGMILALVINRKDTKAKAFWRFCFVLTIAIPQFVSLLVMRTMLADQGAFNMLLRYWGFLGDGTSLPFLTSATWARVVIIIVNLWVGIPFTLLQVTGILQNIPGELYESAKVDGAGPVVTFMKITLPYMLFVTTPYLITTFMSNVNNFNIIFLLSGGGPTPVGRTAGKTDLLVTWLYKLTIDQNYYNIGSVIGIMTFVVLAIVSLLTYRNTKSYKNEEGFQ